MTTERRDEIARVMRAMVRERGAGKTVCPSEVARAVDPDGWRASMDDVRAVARELARAGEVVVTQRGRRLAHDAEWRGAIRLGSDA